MLNDRRCWVAGTPASYSGVPGPILDTRRATATEVLAQSSLDPPGKFLESRKINSRAQSPTWEYNSRSDANNLTSFYETWYFITGW
jgi:hypothetical protein